MAHTTNERPYLWGSNHHQKLGINNNYKNLEVPKPVIWVVLRNEAYDSDDDSVQEEDSTNTKLRTIVIDHEFQKKKGAEYIKSIRSFEWGEQHGLILDKKGRIFSMGRTLNGLLGLSEEESDTCVYNPTQVAVGANHNIPNEKVVKINCGRFHSVAVTNKGHVYTWGEGADCRLGLGFIEKTQSTPC